MILLIDNYDSFTYNLVQLLGRIDPGVDLKVVRNDEVTLPQIEAWAPTHLILSPGPCTPAEAGICCDAVRRFLGKLPILGVCLGHQSIGHAAGAQIVRAVHLMHGKTDRIHHDGQGLFAGLPNPMTATRYHSLVIKPDTLPADYEVTAWSDDGAGVREIMAVRHRQHPVFGVQFHPESFLTEGGETLVRNFLAIGEPVAA